MTKLNLDNLRRIIQNEVRSMVDEDYISPPPMRPGDYGYASFHDDDEDYEDEECPTCGDFHDIEMGGGGCPGKGNPKSRMSLMSLNEDCGCGGKEEEDHGMNDYSLVSMDALGDFSDLNNTNITSDEAYSAGCSVCGDHSGNCGHGSSHDHHNKSYMAKPQLAKISRYAAKLHSMIEDGEALKDWQESHIAQLADDISEVYHSLEYKEFKGEI